MIKIKEEKKLYQKDEKINLMWILNSVETTHMSKDEKGLYYINLKLIKCSMGNFHSLSEISVKLCED